MTRPILSITRPVLIWALHFIAVYALISGSCAPRGLLEADIARAAVATLTLLAGILVLAWTIGAMRVIRRHRGADTPANAHAHIAFWTSAIALLATLFNLWPVIFLSGCTG